MSYTFQNLLSHCSNKINVYSNPCFIVLPKSDSKPPPPTIIIAHPSLVNTQYYDTQNYNTNCNTNCNTQHCCTPHC